MRPGFRRLSHVVGGGSGARLTMMAATSGLASGIGSAFERCVSMVELSMDSCSRGVFGGMRYKLGCGGV